MTPTIEQWRQYQAAFDYFNQALFDGQLPDCILNFSRHNQRRVRGYFSPGRWQKDGHTAHEINLSPRMLATDEPIRSLSTLVHEMVHLWQHAYGRPPRNCYHNREWAEKMEAVGLVPSRTGQPGGQRTGMTCSHYVLEGGPYDLAFRAAPAEVVLPWRPTCEGRAEACPPSRLKTTYRCPACDIKAWGRPGLRLLCVGCSEAMVA